MRDKSLDALSGLLICNMVMLHLCMMCSYHPPIVICIDRILQWFMAWFFFKAGMYAKTGPLDVVLSKSYKRLIRPFFIFSILEHLCWCYDAWLRGDRCWIHYTLSPFKCILERGYVSGNDPLWFLLSLFAVRLIYNVMNTHGIGNRMLIALSFAASYLLYSFEITVPLYLGNIALGVFFFTIGNSLNKCLTSMPMNRKRLVNVSCLTIYLLCLVFSPVYLALLRNTMHYGNYILALLWSVCACILYNELFRRTFLGRVVVLQIIGKHSMGVLCLHYVVLHIVGLLAYAYTQETTFYIMIMANVLVLPPLVFLCNKFQLI